MEGANFNYQLSKPIALDESLAMDTAKLVICNGVGVYNSDIQLFGQVDECEDCELQLMTENSIVASHNNMALALTSIYAYRLELRHNKLPFSSTSPSSFESCRFHVRLEEYGEYVLNVGLNPNYSDLSLSSQTHDSFVCNWRQVKTGNSSLEPLLLLLAATIFLLPLLIFFVRHLLLRLVNISSLEMDLNLSSVVAFMVYPYDTVIDAKSAAEDGQRDRVPVRQRIQCVDVLRGIAIVIMIFNFYGDGSYASLDHSIWNGVQFSDLALPNFVFVMGLSIAITNRRESFRIKRSGALDFAKLIYRIFWRSLVLFFIGLSLTNVNLKDYASIRIFGILQRLSLTYLLTSLATLLALFRYADATTTRTTAKSSRNLFWDLKRFWPEWIPILALVVLQTGLEFSIDPAKWNDTSVASMKGCPRGYLGPGGLHWNGSYQHCTGGAHRLLDLYFLGEAHMNPEPVTSLIYKTIVPFDDMGLLGTCCSVFLCFLGVQAGKVLLYSHSDRQRAARWTVWTLLFGILTFFIHVIPSPYPFNSSLLPLNFSLLYELIHAYTSKLFNVRISIFLLIIRNLL